MQQTISHEALGRRRPMKARELSACHRIAAALHQAGITPNQVSVAGLFAGLGVGIALIMTSLAEDSFMVQVCWALTIVGILLRGACNILDGVLAVECGQSTPAGHLYNEVPDRVSDVAMLVGAGYALGGKPELGWAAAVIALFVAYVRVQMDVAGARQSFGGPMAKPARIATVALAALTCLFAPQFSHDLIDHSGGWGPVSWALAAIVLGGSITAIRRLGIGARELQTWQPDSQ